MQDQVESLRKSEPKVISVLSGKGGVGKSILAVNLALAFQKRNFKILLFDADVGFGSVEILLGTVAPRTLKDFFKSGLKIEDIVYKSPYDVDVISSGIDIEDLLLFNLGDRKKFFDSFSRILRSYDYVIVDFPPGYNENLDKFYLNSDYLIIVTTDEPTSIINTYTLIKVLSVKGVNPEEIFLVLNMVRNMKEGRKVVERLKNVVERFVGVPIRHFFIVREDPVVQKSVERQKPFLLWAEKSQPSLVMLGLREKILKESVEREKEGFLDKIRHLLGIGG